MVCAFSAPACVVAGCAGRVVTCAALPSGSSRLPSWLGGWLKGWPPSRSCSIRSRSGGGVGGGKYGEANSAEGDHGGSASGIDDDAGGSRDSGGGGGGGGGGGEVGVVAGGMVGSGSAGEGTAASRRVVDARGGGGARGAAGARGVREARGVGGGMGGGEARLCCSEDSSRSSRQYGACTRLVSSMALLAAGSTWGRVGQGEGRGGPRPPLRLPPRLPPVRGCKGQQGAARGYKGL